MAKLVVYTITENWREQVPMKHWHAVMQALGRVMKCDIGKRVYYNEETRTAQVENLQQFKRRMGQLV